jgi:hypothetical protein
MAIAEQRGPREGYPPDVQLFVIETDEGTASEQGFRPHIKDPYKSKQGQNSKRGLITILYKNCFQGLVCLVTRIQTRRVRGVRLALEVQGGLGSTELDFVDESFAVFHFRLNSCIAELLLGSLHRGSGFEALARVFVDESYLRPVKGELIMSTLDFHRSKDRWGVERDVIALCTGEG